ncbi:hypothetical protein LAZ67_X000354 [Cordylochernes scorpioides]|uniref:RNase H type-1 domain-containing protein n=1 Tax=Cordylochernes scorpioides TaxID=51811 RepID=A0ABY6LRQ3_9ARAC|nr:hypothetical protein LAZ67_X000354 [Cordylochernes scorpioides]
MFSEGREDVNDEERAGRPSTSTTDEKINEVEKMILVNRRITVREVAEDLNISIGSCHSIFINDLGMRRVAAKFVPKLLNCDQKQHRMNIANEMLDSVRDDPNLLQRVITGDEAGVVHHEFLPQGRTAFPIANVKPNRQVCTIPSAQKGIGQQLELTRPPATIILTDGSQSEKGVGAVSILSSPHPPITVKLHLKCTSFQAELVAIRHGIYIPEIYISSDCQAAICNPDPRLHSCPANLACPSICFKYSGAIISKEHREDSQSGNTPFDPEREIAGQIVFR